MFDGFLFIEFSDQRGYEYAQGYKQKPARKEEWLWLLERNFETNRALHALDQAIAAAAARIGAPRRPRQVVLTLPEPIANHKEWGELHGRTLDFTNADDRVIACEWYVQVALKKWRALAPKHLELAGFYWVAEHSGAAREVLPRVAEVLRKHNQRFFWIPYWNARGAADWRQLGFDFAYQQPNHFFHPDVPDQRLDDACALARANHMGMEMEFDGRAIHSADVFRPRLHAYLNAFDKHGVHAEAAVAYYEGGGALLRMAESDQEDVRALYHTVARWVARRQARADALAGKE